MSSQPNCESCHKPVPESEDIKGIGDMNIVCQSCADNMKTCSQCAEISSDCETVNGQYYCESCEEALLSCYHCEVRFDPNSVGLTEYEGDCYCSDCARSQTAYECHSCGDYISIRNYASNEGEQWTYDELCYDCYERRSQIEHIDSNVDTSIDKSILEGAYVKRMSSNKDELTATKLEEFNNFKEFFNNFFYQLDNSYDSNPLIIRKGAFGYERWGWYETSVEIESATNDSIYKMLDWLICDNSAGLKRPHRKYGQYQPFQYAFAELCTFFVKQDYRYKDGGYLFNDDERYVGQEFPAQRIEKFKSWQEAELRDHNGLSAEGSPTDELTGIEYLRANRYLYLDYYVDHLDRALLRQCVAERKMPDGSPLIKTVNKIFATLEKSASQQQEEGLEYNLNNSNGLEYIERGKEIGIGWNYISAWAMINSVNVGYWEDYKTNSVHMTVPVRIGFDAGAHKKVIRFNESVGACQNSEYMNTLAFNHVAMNCNPHLYLLFYDPNDESRIIGRSVVRLFWKRNSELKRGYQEPHKDTLYIAPSRLYLADYSHAKKNFYVGMFKALDEWKDIIRERLNAESVKLICYNTTRHDTMSVLNYIEQSGSADITVSVDNEDERGRKFVSEWYYPIWLERPSEESYWGYYPDEYQRTESAYVDSSRYSRYATRESFEGEYRLIQVRNER